MEMCLCNPRDKYRSQLTVRTIRGEESRKNGDRGGKKPEERNSDDFFSVSAQ